MTWIWPFVIYAFMSYVVSYILCEYGQKYLYDEVTPYVALKVGAGALIMATFLAWLRPSFDTMFTSYLPQSLLMLIGWAAVFILIYRFQPVHGAAFAVLATVLLFPGLASIVVQSLTTKGPDPRTQSITPAKPLRKGSSVIIGPAPNVTK